MKSETAEIGRTRTGRIRPVLAVALLLAAALAVRAEEKPQAKPCEPVWTAIESAWAAEDEGGLLAWVKGSVVVTLPGVPEKRYSCDQARQVLKQFFRRVATESFTIADKSRTYADGVHRYSTGSGDSRKTSTIQVYLSLVKQDGGYRLDEIRKLDG